MVYVGFPYFLLDTCGLGSKTIEGLCCKWSQMLVYDLGDLSDDFFNHIFCMHVN